MSTNESSQENDDKNKPKLKRKLSLDKQTKDIANFWSPDSCDVYGKEIFTINKYIWIDFYFGNFIKLNYINLIEFYFLISDDSDTDPLYSPALNTIQGKIYVMFAFSKIENVSCFLH